MLSEVFHRRIPLDPLPYVLNVPLKSFTREAAILLMHIRTAAECMIAAFWERKVPLGITDLYTRISDIRQMEKLTVYLGC